MGFTPGKNEEGDQAEWGYTGENPIFTNNRCRNCG
jgi:hypothetical protein